MDLSNAFDATNYANFVNLVCKPVYLQDKLVTSMTKEDFEAPNSPEEEVFLIKLNKKFKENQ